MLPSTKAGNAALNHQHAWTIPAWAAGIVLLCAGAAGAELYRDEARHFTLELPAGWGRMSARALAAINDLVRQRLSPNLSYSMGFQPVDARAGDSPYVLLQIQPIQTAGLSFDDLERNLSREVQGELRRVEGKLSDLGSNLAIGDVVIDRTAKRYIMRTQMDVANVGPVLGYSVGMIGKEGIVTLHCFAREADFEQYLPTFVAIADSFRYDPDYEFGASRSLAFLSRLFSSPLGLAILGAIVGGVVGGLIAFIRFLMKPAPKKRKRTRPKPENA